MAKKTKSDTEREILTTAMERYRRGVEAMDDMFDLAEDDLKFFGGDQWPESIRSQRESDGRPALVINRLPARIRQAISAMRRSNMAINITASDDGDEDVAEIYAGLIRQIERVSHADQAYDSAGELAGVCGMGHFRIRTEYADAMSFDQVIRIERIRSPFAVVFDPEASAYDKSDARWAFVTDWARREDLERQYPKAKDLTSWDSGQLDDYREDWEQDGALRIAEYFEIEERPFTLLQLSDGRVVDSRDVEPDQLAMLRDMGMVAAERQTEDRVVTWRKMCGACVLEGPEEIPCRYIPIVGVFGPEYWDDGAFLYESLVRHAKDPQRQYNYWQSAITEKIALAPKSPWLVTGRMIQGMERIWDGANTENYPYLPYNPDNGLIPQRNAPAAMNTAEIQQAAQAIEDINATMGIYEASSGEQGPEQAGIAIFARAQQGNESTFPWLDNLRRSIEHAGRIIVDMIPRIYDTERMIRILGEDMAEKIVRINQVDPVTGQRKNDLSVGTYDVSISTGPSYPTQRAAAIGVLQGLMNNQAVAPVVAPALLSLIELPEVRKMSDSLKRMLPLGVLDPEDPIEQQKQQAAQNQPPDPQQQLAMQMGQAELAKAQADVLKAQTDARDKAVQSAKTAAQIESTSTETRGKELENMKSALELAIGQGALQPIIEAAVNERMQRFLSDWESGLIQ